jgi:hypothetical protein
MRAGEGLDDAFSHGIIDQRPDNRDASLNHHRKDLEKAGVEYHDQAKTMGKAAAVPNGEELKRWPTTSTLRFNG